VSGSYEARYNVEVTASGEGPTSGTYRSNLETVSVYSGGSFSGTVEAETNAQLIAQGSVSGTITGNEANVVAGLEVSGTITATGEVSVGALGGSVSGSITSEQDSVLVVTSADLIANLQAEDDISAVVQGNILENVMINATSGDECIRCRIRGCG